jgi:hypothetical protein
MSVGVERNQKPKNLLEFNTKPAAVNICLEQINQRIFFKILFSEFHHRINLTPTLLSNLGSKNKTTNSEF